MAAVQGNASAQTNLAALYANGDGVEQNYVRAQMWFILSAASGNENARKNRDIIAKRMTAQQISEAEKMVRDCRQIRFNGCD